MQARGAGRPQGTAGRARSAAAPRRRALRARSRPRARRRPVRRAEAGSCARGGPTGRGRAAQRGVRRGRRVHGAARHLPAGGRRAAHAGTGPLPCPHGAPAPARARLLLAPLLSGHMVAMPLGADARHMQAQGLDSSVWPFCVMRAGTQSHGRHAGCQRSCQHVSETSAGCHHMTRSCRLQHCLRCDAAACLSMW
jgi:hypothetical protein